jgi:hypothetical protein
LVRPGRGFVATTFDRVHTDASITLSGGNLTATGSTAAWKNAFATVSKSSGKFYWEVSAVVAAAIDAIGMANNSLPVSGPFPGNDFSSIGYVRDGRTIVNGVNMRPGRREAFYRWPSI